MRVPPARLLPTLIIFGLALVGCFKDPAAPTNDVPMVGSWLSTDHDIRLAIDISGPEDALTGDWQFTSLGAGGCEGSSEVQRLETSVALQMVTDQTCNLTFQGSILDANTVKGVLTGTMTNAGTDSALTGSALIELHRQ